MNLNNIKKGPITTILGIILILSGVFYILYPIVTSKKVEVSSTILTILFVFGAGLLIAPDNLMQIIKDKIKL